MSAERGVVGWDIGGAHVKAALWVDGEVRDVVQWPCPLWKGLAHLESTLALTFERWPRLREHAHAVTMTGEMADLFATREEGVRQIAETLERALPGPHFFAGDDGWCSAGEAGANWQHIASANWLATTLHAARSLGGEAGVLVDIGSTTTDLIAFRQGRVLTRSRSDVQRLENHELIYQGVVRTPLCALAQRIAWRTTALNVMNEFFASTADVYRLTGELDPAHDQHASADNAPKDAAATRTRLARMIGLDAHDGTPQEWRAFARTWRESQLRGLRASLQHVLQAHALDSDAILVGAGCGAFLVPELAPPGMRCTSYGDVLIRVAAQAPRGTADWLRVCAPSVAVAALFEARPR